MSDPRSEPKVTVRRTIAATCEEVFDAWLDPEGMRAWMMPGTATHCMAEMDPRVGGRFRIVMTGPGAEVVNTGTIRALERPSKLEFTWISSRWGDEETLVTIDLAPRGDACELILTHRRFPAGYSTEELTGGWGRILDGLGESLER